MLEPCCKITLNNSATPSRKPSAFPTSRASSSWSTDVTLYYRLKVAVIKIPPLRNRQADILPLARSFLSCYSGKYHKQIEFAEDAEKALLEYHWPGNVRELENLVQGLVVTGKKAFIDCRDLSIA